MPVTDNWSQVETHLQIIIVPDSDIAIVKVRGAMHRKI
jgi:hypothetical protein